MENKHGCPRQLNGDRNRCYRRQHFIIHFDTSEEAMTYISEERLVAMTLDALEQVAARASKGIVRRDQSIAVCLAFLAIRKKVERWPFDEFWQALECPDDKLRSQIRTGVLTAFMCNWEYLGQMLQCSNIRR